MLEETIHKVKNDELIWNYSYVIKTSEDCKYMCEFFHNKGDGPIQMQIGKWAAFQHHLTVFDMEA